jgi:hypothetical protein
VAALIKQETGLDTELVEGNRGEFTVWVEQAVVAQKGPLGFPEDGDILSSVQRALPARRKKSEV